MKSLTFEPATLEDAEALVAIEEGGATPWGADAFAEEIRRNPPTLFVLRSREGIAAFVAARMEPPDLDILNLAVAKDQRRLGIGRRLMNSLQEEARERGVRTLFLEVRAGNEAARRFYEAQGFQQTQRRRSFYRDPVEDAILMRLKIEP